MPRRPQDVVGRFFQAPQARIDLIGQWMDRSPADIQKLPGRTGGDAVVRDLLTLSEPR